MAKTRIKYTQPINRTRAEELLGELVTAIILKNKAQTAMDRKLTEIRKEYEEKLAGIGQVIEEKTELLHCWASNNPDEFPKDRKSLEMVHGMIGFRTGTSALKPRLKKTWKKILETIKELKLTDLIRSKEEVNKELIISEYTQGKMTLARLVEIGVEVVKEESFFVEPKIEELENRIAV